MGNILEVKDLNKSYDDFELKNINFDLPRGMIMGLVGENGSGKTTTIKSILNIVQKDSGDINIFDMDSIEKEIEIKEDLGVVLDGCNFHRHLDGVDVDKIMRNIYKKWDSDKYFAYLERFKLPIDKKIKDYSKGMEMKLSIAVALSHKAKFLILDEPTAGLDPVVRNEILDELLEFIQDESHSILFSTHITSDLDKIADYITLMQDGEVLFSLDRETIFTEYGLLKCGKEEFGSKEIEGIIRFKEGRFGYEALVRNKEEVLKKYPDMIIDNVSIEDIMIFYIKGEIR